MVFMVYESELYSAQQFNAFVIFIGAVCSQIQTWVFALQSDALEKITEYFYSNARKGIVWWYQSLLSVSWWRNCGSIAADKVAYYQGADKILLKVTNVYAILLITVVSLSALLGISQTVQSVVREGLPLEENYFLPMVCTMPFKVKSWPRYAVAFTWIFVAFSTMIYTKVVTSVIQFIFCFYAVADMKAHQAAAVELRNFNGFVRANTELLWWDCVAAIHLAVH